MERPGHAARNACASLVAFSRLTFDMSPFLSHAFTFPTFSPSSRQIGATGTPLSRFARRQASLLMDFERARVSGLCQSA